MTGPTAALVDPGELGASNSPYTLAVIGPWMEATLGRVTLLRQLSAIQAISAGGGEVKAIG